MAEPALPAPKRRLKDMTVREMMNTQTMNALIGFLLGALIVGWVMYRVGVGDGSDAMCAQIFESSNGQYGCES